MKNLLLITVLSLSYFTNTMACSLDGKDGLVPENDRYIPANEKSMADANMNESEFNEVIDKITAIYDPIVSDHGGRLKAIKEWQSGTVNAYAHRQGGTWNVVLYGGLARHPAITKDGLALATCHEIGHHIGGAPKKSSFFGSSWITNEGQADYFATLKCLRKVFKNDDNFAIVSNLNVPSEVKQKCSDLFTNNEDRLICERGAMAGLSVAKLFQDLRREDVAPDFSTPDTEVVSKTSNAHPPTQCRLDTYYQGAICEVLDKDEVDQNDESVGVCYRANGHKNGPRPFCWFKPKKV